MVCRICIVGTMQSGSTRLFNLVRLLYELEGKSVLSRWKYENDDEKDYDIIIIKVHDCNMDYLKNYDVVLLPVRNILDAGISYKMRFGKDIKNSCLNNINLINKFKNRSDMIFVYERYSLSYIKRLCNKLGMKEKSNIEIIGIMRKLEEMLISKEIVEKDKWDDEEYKKTLLCQAHNTSGGKSNKYVNELSMYELKDLMKNEKIKNFINNYEY